LDRLPLTPHGKLDRRSLPAPEQAGDAALDLVPPRTPQEELLADVWRKVLRLEAIGIRQNFFTLGGDSLLTIQVVSRLAARGYRVSPAELFAFQTIEELAPVLRPITASPSADAATAGADQPSDAGPLPLLPMQRWLEEQS